jgi:protein arginine N-methyltransferase 5
MVAHPPESSVTRIWIQCKPDHWNTWNRIRVATCHPSKLAICLDLSDGPHNSFEEWLGEPVAALLLSDQLIDEPDLLRFLRQNTQPIVTNPNLIPTIVSMLKKFPPLEPHEECIAPYHDTLQLPLQPLRDEMENLVYETFESDGPKYELYKNAILISITRFDGICHIAVVGAGRGGLVDAAISSIRAVAPDHMSRFIITCVEKNQFAAITLTHKLERNWNILNGPKISIQHTDMRNWTPEMKVDILVSELLGSLGDNEASPECLSDSLMTHLCPVRGIAIPYRYFSTLEPVSAHKPWTQVRDMKKFETPLVALFHTFYKPSIEGPQSLFEFVHDRGVSPHSFERSTTLSWTSKSDTLIHGFAGYFHCDLDSEGNVVMSTDPRTATPGMVSWFPAFLPLQTPVYVRSGEKIELFVRRRSTKARMWLEWTLLEPIVQSTNNIDGSHHSVGLI